MAKVLILSIPEEEESLIDKIMAIINNPHDGQEIRSGKSVSVISIGKLQLNITQHSVYKEGKEISLTGTEFKMLYYMASNKGMALSKSGTATIHSDRPGDWLPDGNVGSVCV